jgi:hypothetical protein
MKDQQMTQQIFDNGDSTPELTNDEIQQLMFAAEVLTTFYDDLVVRSTKDYNFFVAPPTNFSYRVN